MASSVAYQLLKFLAKKEAQTAERNAIRDAEVPGVHRPSENIDGGGNFGPTPSQLDRKPEVIAAWEAEQSRKASREGATLAQRPGTIEQQMDAIEAELVKEGKLQYIPENKVPPEEVGVRTSNKSQPKSELELSPNELKAKRDAEKSQVDNFIDPKLPPSQTHFRELENFDRFSAGDDPLPITRRQKFGVPDDLKVPRNAKGKKGAVNDMDIMGDRRAAALTDIVRQLEKHGNANPKNIGEAAKDVIERDIADEQITKVFGRGKKKADPAVHKNDISNEQDFSLKHLEELFSPTAKGDVPSIQGQGVAALKQEAAKAGQESGRTTVKGITVPRNQVSIDNQRKFHRPDADKIAPIQEKLTGPLNDETRIRLMREMAKREANRAFQGGAARRLGNEAEELTQPQRGRAPTAAESAEAQVDFDAATDVEELVKRIARGEQPLGTSDTAPTYRQFKEIGEDGKVKVDKQGREIIDYTDDVVPQEAVEFSRSYPELSRQRINEAQQGPIDVPTGKSGELLEQSNVTAQFPSTTDPAMRQLLEALQEATTSGQPQNSVLLEALQNILATPHRKVP